MNYRFNQAFLDAFVGTGYDANNFVVTDDHGNHGIGIINHLLVLMVGGPLPVSEALHGRLKDGGATMLTETNFGLGGTTYELFMGPNGLESQAVP